MEKKEKVKLVYKKLTHRYENEIVKFYTLIPIMEKNFNSWKINALYA